MSSMENTKDNVLSLPISIIISGLIIAGAIVFTNSNRAVVDQAERLADNQGTPQIQIDPNAVREVTSDDHIRGDINAKVKIVEYSDLECPFCADVHGTVSSLVDEYDGQVAWVYRHLPLTNIEKGFHVNAKRAAYASECVAELGGEDAFWSFIDGIFENKIVPTDANITTLASALGINGAKLFSCIDSGEYEDDIEEDIANSHATGGYGTPWFIIMGPDGINFPVEGAQSTAVFKQVIDQMLAL